jgi:hypothetical protein
MQPIKPMRRGADGDEVANLHLALLYLLQHESIGHEVDKLRQWLGNDVKGKKHVYGRGTTYLVGLYQYKLLHTTVPEKQKELWQHTLVERGDVVDQSTADGLNWLLRKTNGLRKGP